MSKKEEKIPNGPYCHGKLVPRKDGLGYDRINPCPYWKWRKLHLYDIIWILWRDRKFLKELKPLYKVKTYWQLLKKYIKKKKNTESLFASIYIIKTLIKVNHYFGMNVKSAI